MIQNLRKKLFFLFIGSIMLLFTAVLALIIHNNLYSLRKVEESKFQRTASNLLSDLDSYGNPYSIFSLYERDEPLICDYFDSSGHTIYQTDARNLPTISDIIASFETELKKEESIPYGVQPAHTQSGIFYFSHEDIPYWGVCGKLTDSRGEMNTLYLIKRNQKFTELLKEELKSYALIWLMVLAAVAIIGRFLIARAVRPTETAILSQKRFTASASHELKAPLAVILTNAEAMANDPSLPAHLRKHAAAIDTECLRMSGLVQDLLLLSSIDGGVWELNKSPIDLYTLIVSVFEKFEPLCKKNHMELNIDFRDDHYPEFIADKNRLEQILGIFLDNAIHYGNPDTAISLIIHMEHKETAFTGAAWMVFTIQDHGPGIRDEDKPFIYDRFYQAEKSRTHTQRYGLGLSIAYELVAMHKGTIELSDTPGGGCTFQVRFPL